MSRLATQWDQDHLPSVAGDQCHVIVRRSERLNERLQQRFWSGVAAEDRELTSYRLLQSKGDAGGTRLGDAGRHYGRPGAGRGEPGRSGDLTRAESAARGEAGPGAGGVHERAGAVTLGEEHPIAARKSRRSTGPSDFASGPSGATTTNSSKLRSSTWPY
jgi:hypothetical protein